MSEKTKKCDECGNCLLWDTGYSNWTVEGTSVICMIKAHPKPEFDLWYGKNDDLLFAEQCRFFRGDGPHHLDVEKEELDGLPDWVKVFIETEGHP